MKEVVVNAFFKKSILIFREREGGEEKHRFVVPFSYTLIG